MDMRYSGMQVQSTKEVVAGFLRMIHSFRMGKSKVDLDFLGEYTSTQITKEKTTSKAPRFANL